MSEIDKIRARVEEATPGPWTILKHNTGIRSSRPYAYVIRPDGTALFERLNSATGYDIELIAHARQDIPMLLDRLDRIRHEGRVCQHSIPGEEWSVFTSFNGAIAVLHKPCNVAIQLWSVASPLAVLLQTVTDHECPEVPYG